MKASVDCFRKVLNVTLLYEKEKFLNNLQILSMTILASITISYIGSSYWVTIACPALLGQENSVLEVGVTIFMVFTD